MACVCMTLSSFCGGKIDFGSKTEIEAFSVSSRLRLRYGTDRQTDSETDDGHQRIRSHFMRAGS